MQIQPLVSMYFISFHPVGTSNCLNICSEYFVQNETTFSFMYLCGVFHQLTNGGTNEWLFDGTWWRWNGGVFQSARYEILPSRDCYTRDWEWQHMLNKILKPRDVNYLADLLFAPSERRLRCSLAWQTIGFNLLCRVAWEEKKRSMGSGKQELDLWLSSLLLIYNPFSRPG